MLVKEVRALLEGKSDDDVFQVSVTELPARFHVTIDVIKPAIEEKVEPVAAPNTPVTE